MGAIVGDILHDGDEYNTQHKTKQNNLVGVVLSVVKKTPPPHHHHHTTTSKWMMSLKK